MRLPLTLALLMICVSATADGIRPAAIGAHIRFLADDLLEGRGPGTRGYDLAARYVATALESYGLEPAGTSGYFQNVQLRQVVRDTEGSTLTLARGGKPLELVNGTDYLVSAPASAEDSAVTAPLVFVGYGVSAPDLKHDDLAGVDLEGRIAVFIGGAPPSFASPVRAHYSGIEKARTLAGRGAVGTIQLTSAGDDRMYPWPRIVSFASFPRMRAMRPDGTLIDVFPQLRGSATVSLDASRRLMRAAGHDFDKVVASLKEGKRQSFALPFEAAIHGVATHTTIGSSNVAALLRGSDPVLRDEYVVYTAHLDHMGIGVAVDGDDIYNGAYDNASGSAALLEIARVFAEMPVAPKRSVLFLFVTAEERGLLGSTYFAQYPTVPAGKIVANVNIDGLSMMCPAADVVALGAEHSSLGDVVNRVAASLGFAVTPDPEPEQAYFVRSDQYSFVRQGIPAVFIDAGVQSADPKIDCAAVLAQWIQSVYHTPKDDASQPFRLDTGTRLATLHLRVGAEIANAAERPSWNPGDFFGRIYGRK